MLLLIWLRNRKTQEELNEDGGFPRAKETLFSVYSPNRSILGSTKRLELNFTLSADWISFVSRRGHLLSSPSRVFLFFLPSVRSVMPEIGF